MQTKILSLVLLLSIVCYGTALRVIDQNAHKTLACCGPSNSYDTTTQICCINTVFPIPTAGSTLQNQCCGNRLLTTTQQCCVAVPGAVSINDRAIDASATCCGTNALTDSTTQVCCSGTVVSNPTGLTQCCGNRLINPSTDLCCGTTFISGGAGKQCCGNAGFAPATQQCCGTTIVTNANGVQCCGSTTYDPTTQTCCGTKVGAGASMSCCGTQAYNQATQICCTDGTTSTVLSNTQGNLQCCGPAKTYDPTTQTCCSKSVDNYVKSGTDANGCTTYTDQPTLTYTVGSVAGGSCCDGIPYDSTTSICCLNKVISNPTNKQCCGTNLYDPSNDVCCPDPAVNGARVYTGKAAAGLECCVTSTYDPTTQACPCQVVVSLNNDLSQNNNDPNVQAGCCGSTQYDSNNKLCCANGNSLFNLDPAAGLQCCPQDGQTIYNPGYQVCCEKKVACPGKPSTSTPTISAPSAATISPNQNKKLVQCGDSCCDGQGYFKAYQLCCDGKVVDFNNDAGSATTNPLSCCGNTIFNHIYEACCSEDIGNGKVNTAVYGGPGNWQLCCHN